MNANKLCSKIGNNQGSILVFVTLALIAILAVAALVIDFGFMYSNKGKLQHAADAGALAGAGLLHPQTVMDRYTAARSGAKYYAMQNFDLVNLSDNTSNNPGGDVVLGHWDSTATPKFQIITAAKRINAVKVVARRTGEVADTGIGASSKFNLFIAKIVGINTMGAKSEAIAYRPPRARTYILAGYSSVCNRPATEFPKTLTPATDSIAWTSLQNNATSDRIIRDNFFCPVNKLPFEEVCGTNIYTTNGVDASVFDAVETDFYDPNYDRGMKTFDGSGNVDTWKVIVPVSEPHVLPTATGSASDPKMVWGYAELLIIRACGQGNACSGRSFNAPGNTCRDYKKTILIKTPPTCYSCANSTALLGAMPVLAK